MQHLKTIFFAFTCFALFSCGNGEPSNGEDDFSGAETKAKAEPESSKRLNAQNIFNSIPSPQEFDEIIARTNLEYDGTVLNNPQDYKKYASDSYKALNLGVYGTDLAYTSVFENTSESMTYLKRVNQACKSLGINGVFDENTLDRIEANKQNKDSLLVIITKSFWNADKFLTDNNREGTSSLMVAGAWIEGIYLSLNAAKNSRDIGVVKKIAAQKKTLKDVIALIENTKTENELSYLLPDLKNLNEAFKTFDTSETINKNKFDDDADKFITSLDANLSKLRNKITMNNV